MKKKIIILSLFIILILCGCTKEKENIANDIRINDKVEKISEQGVTIELDKFYYQDGYSTINLYITNNNDYDIYIGNYKVYVYDKKDNLLGIFNPIFNSNINSGKKQSQMFSIEADFSNADYIEYEFNEVEKVDY